MGLPHAFPLIGARAVSGFTHLVDQVASELGHVRVGETTIDPVIAADIGKEIIDHGLHTRLVTDSFVDEMGARHALVGHRQQQKTTQNSDTNTHEATSLHPASSL